jgi:hypothetical protein
MLQAALDAIRNCAPLICPKFGKKEKRRFGSSSNTISVASQENKNIECPTPVQSIIFVCFAYCSQKRFFFV